MSINFVIPCREEELLEDNDDRYYVKDIIPLRNLHIQLREARNSYKEDGPEFIIHHFDTYFSVFHHGDAVGVDLVLQAFADLHKAVEALSNNLGFLLEDKESISGDVQSKFLIIIKMLMYIYTKMILLVEKMKAKENMFAIPSKGKSKKKREEDDVFVGYDEMNVIVKLTNIMQREISFFWNPPFVEDAFVSMIAEVIYRYLENPQVKSARELRIELFNTIGILVKNYHHGLSFRVRMVQMIKSLEHLVHCVPEGIQILVNKYNCKSLVRDFVKEITEWQTNEKYQDGQGTKNCSAILVEMAVLMPELMIPEVMYLNSYLAHESYTLRNSVLAVITEVIINVLTKHELNEEEKESRDEFFAILEEHIYDVSGHVRAKVFQYWARLQTNNSIPIKIQHSILEKAIAHLRDKGALVRKAAAACVTTFLTHNTYGARLQLQSIEAEFKQKDELLKQCKEKLSGIEEQKIQEIEKQWEEKLPEIRAAIEKKLEDIEEKQNGNNMGEIETKEASDLIRLYLENGKYTDAFVILQNVAEKEPQWIEMHKNFDEDNTVDFYLILMKMIYSNISNIMANILRTNSEITEDDLKRLELLSTEVDFLTDTIKFLRLLDNAFKPMKELLESSAIGDVQEAVVFFVAAYQFNLDTAAEGALEMMTVMQSSEADRKNLVVEAFKKIYLETDSKNLLEHTTQIADRLIHLVEIVPVVHYENLKQIISEWTSKGLLDNSVIDILWQYFIKKIPVSDDKSCAALHILGLAALGRPTIVSRNIQLIDKVVFDVMEGGNEPRGMNDMLLLKTACDILALMGMKKQSITDKNPPFTISPDDVIWKHLFDILDMNFEKPIRFYNKSITAAVSFLFKVCSKPYLICERFTLNVIGRINKLLDGREPKELERFLIIRIVHLFGEMALRLLNFLDENIYKELKRRHHIREELKDDKKGGRNKKKSKKVAESASKSISSSVLNESSRSIAQEESTLEGAQAEDTDAEFILHILENDVVTGSGGLAQMASFIRKICEQQQIYQDTYLQSISIISLLRYMLVSSRFCENNIHLIFTILEKTCHAEIKCTILLHCSDLLERFPNVVEPWTPKIYARLRDSNREVRTAAFYMLSNMILRDMILVHGHISEMARSIVDEDENLNSMSKNFFSLLSHKTNSLYSVLPDIFSHLCDLEELQEENLRTIMKFLFGLIDKNKHMDNLVDRFCTKYSLGEDQRKCRNITYCLSLINYSDKGLGRLNENFPLYKHLVHDNEIYGFLKQILNNAQKATTKNEVKAVATEIEEKINDVFKSNREENKENSETPVKKSQRGRRRKMKKVASHSDSD